MKYIWCWGCYLIYKNQDLLPKQDWDGLCYMEGVWRLHIQSCLIVTELAWPGWEGGCHDSEREKLETTERGKLKTVRAPAGPSDLDTNTRDLGHRRDIRTRDFTTYSRPIISAVKSYSLVKSLHAVEFWSLDQIGRLPGSLLTLRDNLTTPPSTLHSFYCREGIHISDQHRMYTDWHHFITFKTTYSWIEHLISYINKTWTII